MSLYSRETCALSAVCHASQDGYWCGNYTTKEQHERLMRMADERRYQKMREQFREVTVAVGRND